MARARAVTRPFAAPQHKRVHGEKKRGEPYPEMGLVDIMRGFVSSNHIRNLKDFYRGGGGGDTIIVRKITS